jgi:hypothetical protein
MADGRAWRGRPTPARGAKDNVQSQNPHINTTNKHLSKTESWLSLRFSMLSINDIYIRLEFDKFTMSDLL